MKKSINKLVLVLVGCVFSVSTFANDPETDQVVKECLSKWEKHPFNEKDLKYRTIATKVKVMGIGGNVKDDEKSQGPELILVKPGVSVMAKTKYELMNPNGWYCLKGRVSVMGKIDITVHCKAKLASSGDGVAVLGATDDKSGGVSVLGSTRVTRRCE